MPNRLDLSDSDDSFIADRKFERDAHREPTAHQRRQYIPTVRDLPPVRPEPTPADDAAVANWLDLLRKSGAL